MTVTINLPLPPSVNGLFANVSKERREKAAAKGKKLPGRVRTERYRVWANAAGWELKTQKPGHVEGPYVMALEMRRSDKNKMDLGNTLKAIEDLLVDHGVIEDDGLAERIHLGWADVEGCRVVISPAGGVAA